MSKPRLLDLFCGGGGAAMGYSRAGFEVVGVDISPQPHYPFEFHQADAMTFPLEGFDVVHASPPCQAFTPLNARHGYRHTTDLLTPIRRRLIASGVPWIIENVPGAPFHSFVFLCGGMFGLRTYRHRRFETSWMLFQPAHPRHTVLTTTRARFAGWKDGLNATVTGNIGVYVGPEAMGIDWMNGDELSQAIPPPYTRWIGEQLCKAVAA